MAKALFRGYVGVYNYHGGSSSAQKSNAMLYTANGIADKTDTFPVTNLYIWEGRNTDVVQFQVNINAANVNQRNFAEITDGAAIGLSVGCFILDLSAAGQGTGNTYLCIPQRAFMWFDGTDTIDAQITCEKLVFRYAN